MGSLIETLKSSSSTVKRVPQHPNQVAQPTRTVPVELAGSNKMIEMHGMDAFFKEDHNLDVAALVNALWQNRNSEDVTEQLCHLLSRYIIEKDVFNEIEFYLPQIAHMIIHFGSSNQKLWKLMIMICQVSMHSALLLSFIFYASMEDYQPEGSDGKDNPHKDRNLYSHCASLLLCIEKVILLGCPEAVQLDKKYPDDSKRDLEFEELEAECRVRDSEMILESEKMNKDMVFANSMKGKLWYKRVEKKSMFVRKTWKPRYFRIEEKVLACYHDQRYSELLRSIPLHDCSIFEVHNPNHENCFEIHSPITFTVFKLRAESREEMEKWIERISGLIDEIPEVDGGKSSQRENLKHGDSTYNVTKEQKNRFTFFTEQRRFIESLTSICEDLRFMDPRLHQDELKKRVSQLKLPSYCYLSIYGSTDTWSRIINTLPNESHAFKTKARVPTLLLFEMDKHSDGNDVATFLNEELGHVMSQNNDSSSASRSKYSCIFKSSSSKVLKARRQSMWSTAPDSVRKLPDFESEMIENGHSLPDDHSDLAALRAENDGEASKAGESFAMKANRIRKSSPYSHLSGWDLDGLICKSNDDLRQEVFVMQMITFFTRIFRAEKIPAWLLSYTIMSTSQTTGLIQLIPNSSSLDGLKKDSYWPGSLRLYFEKTFGPPEGAAFRRAQEAFISSMAGYSVVCYILAIKDRHNGNIMLDTKGHIIHIDYGFVFGIAPGKKFSMETAPWKLTEEMVDVMGGINSPGYERYVALTTDALRVARKYGDECLRLMEILAYKSNYPAFSYNPNAMRDLHNRLLPNVSDDELPVRVVEMMKKSYNHAGAIRYDKFQVLTNGIAR